LCLPRMLADTRCGGGTVRRHTGGTSINAACSLVNVLYDTTPLEEGGDLNAYADRLGDTICRVLTGSADAAEARGDFARQCGECAAPLAPVTRDDRR